LVELYTTNFVHDLAPNMIGWLGGCFELRN